MANGWLIVTFAVSLLPALFLMSRSSVMFTIRKLSRVSGRVPSLARYGELARPTDGST